MHGIMNFRKFYTDVADATSFVCNPVLQSICKMTFFKKIFPNTTFKNT